MLSVALVGVDSKLNAGTLQFVVHLSFVVTSMIASSMLELHQTGLVLAGSDPRRPTPI